VGEHLFLAYFHPYHHRVIWGCDLFWQCT
jgi:hypothetical protein